MRARLTRFLRQLDPRDVFLVGGLGCFFSGLWLIAGPGWALMLTGFILLIVWSLTLCRSRQN